MEPEYTTINVKDLNRFEAGTVVTPELLEETGLVKQVKDGIKVLGDGALENSLTVKAEQIYKVCRLKKLRLPEERQR